MVFSHGDVQLYVDPFWNFDEKVGPFSEFLCLMEVSKIRFFGPFWGKMTSIFQTFS